MTLSIFTSQAVLAAEEQSTKIKIIIDEINLGSLKPEAFSKTLDFQIEVRLRFFEKLRQVNGQLVGYNVTLNEMTKAITASPRLALVAPKREHETHQLRLAAEIDLNELEKKLAQIPNPKQSILEVEVKQQGMIGSRTVVALALTMDDLQQLALSHQETKKLSLAGRQNSTTYLTLTR